MVAAMATDGGRRARLPNGEGMRTGGGGGGGGGGGRKRSSERETSGLKRGGRNCTWWWFGNRRLCVGVGRSKEAARDDGDVVVVDRACLLCQPWTGRLTMTRRWWLVPPIPPGQTQNRGSLLVSCICMQRQGRAGSRRYFVHARQYAMHVRLDHWILAKKIGSNWIP
jgi:hypothetical protein